MMMELRNRCQLDRIPDLVLMDLRFLRLLQDARFHLSIHLSSRPGVFLTLIGCMHAYDEYLSMPGIIGMKFGNPFILISNIEIWA